MGITGHVGRIGLLLVESDDAAVGLGLDHAELDGLLPGHGDGGHGDLGALLLMELDHVADVHPVDVIGPEDGDDVRIGLLDQVDVLINGVGRALVPGLARGAHLRGNGDDELIPEKAARTASRRAGAAAATGS